MKRNKLKFEFFLLLGKVRATESYRRFWFDGAVWQNGRALSRGAPRKTLEVRLPSKPLRNPARRQTPVHWKQCKATVKKSFDCDLGQKCKKECLIQL